MKIEEDTLIPLILPPLFSQVNQSAQAFDYQEK